MTGPQEPAANLDSDRLAEWASNHTPLLGSMLLFVLVVMRVLRVAGFDPATATTILREAGPISILLGVLAISLPGLLIATAVYLILYGLGGPGPTHTAWRP